MASEWRATEWKSWRDEIELRIDRYSTGRYRYTVIQRRSGDSELEWTGYAPSEEAAKSLAGTYADQMATWKFMAMTTS